MNTSARIAVIGAGLAGLSCAAALTRAGLRVTVFDKSRGVSGRASTRRGDAWQCDHGAQYFTARDALFVAEVERWQQAGVAALWEPQLVQLGADGATARKATAARYVGTPRMTAPATWMAAQLAVHTGATVTSLQREAGRWRLQVAQEKELISLADTLFDAVVMAVPAPQAAVLLAGPAPALASIAGGVAMQACWAVMLRYDAPLALGFDAAFVEQGPLSWIARDSAKPGRPAGETWLLHASAAWSDAHVELTAEQATAELVAAFCALGGRAPGGAEMASAHRWRYARTAPARNDVCVLDDADAIGMCGDWLNGGTVEAAWISGHALALRLAASYQGSSAPL